ncbi:hypothetical protein C0995_006838, partial [Termitomyces sp. Mi166
RPPQQSWSLEEVLLGLMPPLHWQEASSKGFDVTLIECHVFPRYHVGESILPSCRHFLAFIGAEELIKNHGFVIKPGGAVKLRQDKQEGYANFIEIDPENITWNVFDDLLLRHASASGVKVFEGLRVTDIRFSGERPVSAIYETQDSEPREINFEYLVDASGRTGIMSTKYLKNRHFTKSLMSMALWGYWRGGDKYAPGTKRENAPWIEAFTGKDRTDETGWAWYIPLHDGTTSVGVVISKDSYAEKKALARDGVDDSITKLYIDQLARAPGLIKLLGQAKLTSEIKSAADYSYSASHYAGPGYRIVGDAGAFIDPLFSTGVHLAFNGGLFAAITIAASIREDCTEAKAIEFHNTKIEISYTRFLITILGVYKQIRAQKEDILAGTDEDNFDKVFRLLRPSAADIDSRLTPEELEETFDFFGRIVLSTQPQMQKEAEYMHNITVPHGPILLPSIVSSIVGDDEGTKRVVHETARKMTHHPCIQNKIHGYYVNLMRGELGMRKA